jgi:phosphate uptake regulator
MSILASCDKKGGDAVVLAKEHIAARAAPKSEATASPSPTPAKESETYRELRKDEIAVDQYVMRGVDRGISRDPRAADDEQWIVKVQMVYDLRKIDIYAEKEQFEKVKEGDRIKVTYRLGKYTGTVWGAAIR